MVMDKYDIIWETFQDDLIETRKSLLKEKLFADVTLVSGDMTKILAHRTVLSSASSVFKQLLMLSHDHGHPVLFLRGVKHEDLQYIVEFIYSGQVSLPEGESATVHRFCPRPGYQQYGETRHNEETKLKARTFERYRQLDSCKHIINSNIKEASFFKLPKK